MAVAVAEFPPEMAPTANVTCPSIVEREVLTTNVVQKQRHADGTKTINGLHVLQEIGSGSFAKVKLCEEQSSAERFALKVFRKGALRRQRDFIGGGDGSGMKIKTALDKVYGEIATLKRVAHPNCIRLHAVFEEPDNFGKLYMVLEYCGGGATMDWDPKSCTFSSSQTKGLIPEQRARAFIRDIFLGLAYLHRSGIAHRDIKPQNLLLHEDGGVKVSDFGVSIETDENGWIVGTEGTYYFYAPEMCSSGYQGHDGRKADVWAAGVTLWAFVYGTVPFACPDLAGLFERIAVARVELPAEPRGIGEDCRATILNLLARYPAERPFAWEIGESPWVQGAGAACGIGSLGGRGPVV